ncbi:6-phosphogluconate dehydrogenase, protein [Cordyceps fumosorosea ARSEF 2679]|uniref:6-phosphogluconate dehydrogenase, protein n=1 Tax=Cordyceps fumosorosea (strain ARSEF 2679) TaxID=1081104 RepID=A0A167LZ79_CORFA|nr:6-phosphogluconate dehydrogenase, protein [Cordyceps fumosorosea ARSEF 2679]OAA53716.1 6-phosphogluconate dehydrogenase, protein [Cordyceps fumosorosea ARSEF 2679]
MQTPPTTSDGVENAAELNPLVGDYYDQTPPGEIVDSDDDLHNLEPIWPGQNPVVAVIGVGYVGEHLVRAFSGHCRVIGFDVSQSRVDKLNIDATHPRDTCLFTSRASDLAPATHFLIAVPTLLRPDLQAVDSSALRQALAVISPHARPNAVVVIESSVAVGTTRTLLGPLAGRRGLLAGMSPERVDPRAQVAEMAKLYENCQRMVGIAYANEMADACRGLRVDPWEVCRAAATKPFGYMPLAPGVGVGGHCIPVNPWYLLAGGGFPLLRSATEAMRARPGVLAGRILERFAEEGEEGEEEGGRRPRVLVVGIGFKPGQAHLANSPGLELARSLVVSGRVEVAWADPLVSQEAVPQIRRLDEGEWTAAALRDGFDYIVAAMRQTGVDFSVLGNLPTNMVEWWFAQ